MELGPDEFGFFIYLHCSSRPIRKQSKASALSSSSSPLLVSAPDAWPAPARKPWRSITLA